MLRSLDSEERQTLQAFETENNPIILFLKITSVISRMEKTKPGSMRKYKYERNEQLFIVSVLAGGTLLALSIYYILIRAILAALTRLEDRLSPSGENDYQVSLENFKKMSSDPHKYASIDPVGYNRTIIIERDEKKRADEDEKFNRIVNLGLIGTLVGLALAFYAAAASFPADVAESMKTNASQAAVVTGLIQSIYSYSFAVISSLVAYSVVLSMKYLREVLTIDYVKRFDEDVEQIFFAAVASPSDPLFSGIDATVNRYKQDIQVSLQKTVKDYCDRIIKVIQHN